MEKIDKQITCMAGEFLTAGKLFKKGFQVSLTFRNAKGIDLFAHNQKTGKIFNVQVKTSRKKNNFRELNGKEIRKETIYVFLILNEFENNEDYFIVKGSVILQNVSIFFGSTYSNKNLPEKGTVNYRALEKYKDNWVVFDQ